MEPRALSHPVRLAGASLMRLQSDARLVEMARAGHEGAFETIVQRYRPALLRYCTGILGPSRAEDAVQQALINAHAALSSHDDRSLDLRPWLYRIAHNSALNVLRGRRDESELSDQAPASGVAPHDAVVQRERLDELLTAIARLPQGQRDALLLRELEGRSHEEIGDALGVTSGAARAQLFRARAAVRAACTALTPAPLLLRLADLGGSAVAAGGGELTSSVVTKAVAGVLATTALVGGATTTGVLVHRTGGDGEAVAAAAVESRPGPRAPARAAGERPSSQTNTISMALLGASGAGSAGLPGAPGSGGPGARPAARLTGLGAIGDRLTGAGRAGSGPGDRGPEHGGRGATVIGGEDAGRSERGGSGSGDDASERHGASGRGDGRSGSGDGTGRGRDGSEHGERGTSDSSGSSDREVARDGSSSSSSDTRRGRHGTSERDGSRTPSRSDSTGDGARGSGKSGGSDESGDSSGSSESGSSGGSSTSGGSSGSSGSSGGSDGAKQSSTSESGDTTSSSAAGSATTASGSAVEDEDESGS